MKATADRYIRFRDTKETTQQPHCTAPAAPAALPTAQIPDFPDRRGRSVLARPSVLRRQKVLVLLGGVFKQPAEAERHSWFRMQSRRRSTRSASSLAHYKISEALSPSAENTKKRKTARDLSDSSREKRPNKEIVPAAEVEDRGALGCITNSPAKSSTQSRR